MPADSRYNEGFNSGFNSAPTWSRLLVQLSASLPVAQDFSKMNRSHGIIARFRKGSVKSSPWVDDSAPHMKGATSASFHYLFSQSRFRWSADCLKHMLWHPTRGPHYMCLLPSLHGFVYTLSALKNFAPKISRAIDRIRCPQNSPRGRNAAVLSVGSSAELIGATGSWFLVWFVFDSCADIMSEQLKFIVEQLNKEPFKRGYNLIRWLSYSEWKSDCVCWNWQHVNVPKIFADTEGDTNSSRLSDAPSYSVSQLWSKLFDCTSRTIEFYEDLNNIGSYQPSIRVCKIPKFVCSPSNTPAFLPRKMHDLGLHTVL